MADLNKHRANIAKMMDAMDDECKMYREEAARLQVNAPVRLGPVVTIRSEDRGEGLFCNTNCDLSPQYHCIHQALHNPRPHIHRPKDTCPKPAPDGHEWRLALFAKEDAPDDSE